MSWGSRRFYRWALDDAQRVTNAGDPPERCAPSTRRITSTTRTATAPGGSRMLCSGLNEYRVTPEAAEFALGGIELVDLDDRPAAPPGAGPAVERQGPGDDPQPVLGRAQRAGLRFYFVPEDDNSRLFIYDVAVD